MAADQIQRYSTSDDTTFHATRRVAVNYIHTITAARNSSVEASLRSCPGRSLERSSQPNPDILVGREESVGLPMCLLTAAASSSLLMTLDHHQLFNTLIIIVEATNTVSRNTIQVTSLIRIQRNGCSHLPRESYLLSSLPKLPADSFAHSFNLDQKLITGLLPGREDRTKTFGTPWHP